ncbi:ryanodine receptor 2-like isoform X1 [Vicugna pacos]|uniref:Ryanodine receptor 2-like isoform X1 n=1 Tax=Vicugna pacos TaxID=30538 RepID=A0ABM5CH18_VICPA
MKLRKNYQLTSGYKPAPMDLSFIKLTPSQEAMVDKLAENAHIAWAWDRIRQGWTCGIQQDVKNRRNPRLVPYTLLDDRTKKSNKDSLCEVVCMLLGFVYSLEAPNQDHAGVPARASALQRRRGAHACGPIDSPTGTRPERVGAGREPGAPGPARRRNAARVLGRCLTSPPLSPLGRLE